MLDTLTKREHEILLLIAEGYSNADIGRKLYLSRGTVKAHSHNIYSKLGVTSRTQALIKAQELGILADTEGAAVVGSTLPSPLTPFIGRYTELERLADMLRDERVRLITILGAGGMGKTRLAMEVARQQSAAFKDNVFFVSLSRLTDASNLASAIIEDMGLRFQANENPQQQLLTHLQDKRLLLILDNFEHLTDATDLLIRILAIAPAVKVLVTSRERLNLSSEVVLVLGGLEYDPHIELNEAVQLLLDRARAGNPAFELHAGDQPHVRRICQLTQGMPLALVLAAGWLDMLTLEEIAGELAQSIDILESQLSDLPVRQRSMRAVIAASWNRLTDDEQRIFIGLSVFRGSFTREAAQKVTGANLQQLRMLVNRSFLTVHDGRYSLHELLRQFAEAELAKRPDMQRQVHELHCECYANFLFDRLENMYRGHKQSVMNDIVLDLDNVRAAWRWAVEYRNVDALYRAARTVSAFWHTQGRYLEGIELLEKAVAMVGTVPDSPLRNELTAILSTDLGWYYMRFGRLDDCAAMFTRAHRIFEQLGFPTVISTTSPLVGLAFVASIRGSYAQATELAEEALRLYQPRQDYSNQAYALYALTGIKLAQGQYEQARAYGEQAVTMTRLAEDRWVEAYCLIELGNVARAMGDDDTARRHYQASYVIRAEFEDPEGMAAALNNLGALALRRRDFVEAKRLFQQSQALYLDIHDQGGLATALHGLGQVALGMGHLHVCRRYLHDALRTAKQIEYMPLLFAALLTAADMRLECGEIEAAHDLLAFIQQHPSCSQETKDQAAHRYPTADRRVVEHDLRSVVESVLAELSGIG